MARPWDNLSEDEWEAICKRCGKCCLYPLQDMDSGEIYHTNILCRYFDLEKSICTVYDKRCELVPSCLKLNKDNVDKLPFMPKSCAYRRLFDTSYHDKPTPSIKGRVVREQDVDEANLEDYIVDWEDL
jgi:uncharacterized cysteine cluster protein YcgN (CxxCxxCC family)